MSDIITGVTNSLLAENEWERRRIAELEAENAALRQDAAVVHAIETMPIGAEMRITRTSWRSIKDVRVLYAVNDLSIFHIYEKPTLWHALAAAGLMEEEK